MVLAGDNKVNHCLTYSWDKINDEIQDWLVQHQIHGHGGYGNRPEKTFYLEDDLEMMFILRFL